MPRDPNKVFLNEVMPRLELSEIQLNELLQRCDIVPKEDNARGYVSKYITRQELGLLYDTLRLIANKPIKSYYTTQPINNLTSLGQLAAKLGPSNEVINQLLISHNITPMQDNQGLLFVTSDEAQFLSQVYRKQLRDGWFEFSTNMVENYDPSYEDQIISDDNDPAGETYLSDSNWMNHD